jgi:glycogen operon protein
MPNAEHMDEQAWSNGLAKSLMVFLNGSAIPEPDPRGQQILDDSFLVLFNAHHEGLSFTLPDAEYGEQWLTVIDTAREDVDEAPLEPTWQVQVEAHSIVVLRCPRVPAAPPVAGLTEAATA